MRRIIRKNYWKANRRYREKNKEIIALKQKKYQRERYLQKTKEILERNRNMSNNLEKLKNIVKIIEIQRKVKLYKEMHIPLED